ncbi:50S ribosomal protein L21 [Candidatus Uhrbacteria bacterium]|nr:50S ribosomal protein L21 [Candidatus Uhrbacteria bacterium]
MFAVIKTGGKQYKVKEGDILKVEQLPGDVDTEIDLGEVLLLADAEKETLEVGTPKLEQKVKAKIVEQGRGKKITIIKYKPKSRYRRKTGHRQPYTKVQITKI